MSGLHGLKPDRVIRAFERAQMENCIKGLKIGVRMEHMPCGEFEANATYFSIGVLTYNLMVAQKYFVIQEGLEKGTIATLRWKLVQIAAWIVEHGNRVRLKIATTLKKFTLTAFSLKIIVAM